MDDERIEISVVLPIYNIPADYLNQCFESLHNQSFEAVEFLMINDGSTKNIYNVCKHYLNRDSRFVYLEQPHNGVSEARNKGLEAAKGDYIAFVDPDDWVSEEYLERLLQLAKSASADISIVDAMVHYEKKNRENHFLNMDHVVLTGNEKNRLLYQCIGKKICDYYPSEIAAGVPWGKLFKKEFLLKNDLKFVPGMPRMQDNIFSLYSYELADRIVYQSDCLYHYRKNDISVSHRYNPEIMAQFEIYYDETNKFLVRFRKEEVLFQALKMKELTSFNSYLLYYFFQLKDTDKNNVNKQIDDLLKRKPYCESLQHVDYRILTFQESIFVFCLKHRLFTILRWMVLLRNKRN